MFIEPPIYFAELRFPRIGATQSQLCYRWLWTVLGIAMAAIAIVGIYLPGLPTTGPLILASLFLGRGNPELREKVLSLRILRFYRGYLDGTKPFSMKLRCLAAGSMWLSITVSSVVFSYSTEWAAIPIALCVSSGLVGTVGIFLYGRQTPDVAS